MWTFEQIGSVLKVAGDKKCQEAQACLEGTTCTYVFFNFIFFLTLHSKSQGAVRETEQEAGRGQERGWEGMDRQPVKNK